MRLSRKARVRKERRRRRKKLAIQMASVLSMTTFGAAQVTNPSFALLYEHDHLQEHQLSAAFVFESTIQEMSEKSAALRLRNEELKAELIEISLQFNRLRQSISFHVSGPGTVADDVYGSGSSVTRDVYGSPSVSIDVYGPSPQDVQLLYSLLEKAFEIHSLIERNDQEMMRLLDQLYTYYAQAELEIAQATTIYEAVQSMTALNSELSDEVTAYHIEQALQQVTAAERVFEYIKVGLESVEADVAYSAEQRNGVLRLIEEMERELRQLNGYARPAPQLPETGDPVEQTEELDEEHPEHEEMDQIGEHEDLEEEQQEEEEQETIEDELEDEEEQREDEEDVEDVETEEREESSKPETDDVDTEFSEQPAHQDDYQEGVTEAEWTYEPLQPDKNRRNNRSGNQNEHEQLIGEPVNTVRNKKERTEEEEDQ